MLITLVQTPASVKGLLEEILPAKHQWVVKEKNRRYLHEWVDEMSLNDSADSPSVNYMELRIYDTDGFMPRHFSRVSDVEITAQNMQQLVGGARVGNHPDLPAKTEKECPERSEKLR